MKPKHLLRIIVCRLSFALAILLTASCAASRSRTLRSECQAVETLTTEETVQEQSRNAHEAHRSTAEQSTRHEIRTMTTESVAAEEAEIVVPLRALDSLPDGAQFAMRKGRTSIAARRSGDALIVTARSDSLGRVVTSYERIDARHFAATDSTSRSATDTLRLRNSECSTSTVATRTDIREERRTPARRGWWFMAGVAVGVLLALLVLLMLRLRRGIN